MKWPEGTPTPYILVYPTVFHEAGSDKELHSEDGLLLLTRGMGVLWGPTRYRVTDSWLSFDKHGRFDVGMHVFLTPVEEGSEDDTLGLIAPDYFQIEPRI